MIKSLIAFIFTFTIFAFSNSTHASIDQAPPSFPYKDGNATFVDFQKAHYDMKGERRLFGLKVKSTIEFVMPSEGYPLFDLVQNMESIKLNGKDVTVSEIDSPDKITKYRVVNEKIAPGNHQLEIVHNQTTNVHTGAGNIEMAFWMSDFRKRGYLESFLPSNLEYDQYEMEIDLDITAGRYSSYHELFTNGDSVEIVRNVWNIKTPNYFNASSLFFHLLPTRSILSRETFTYKSKLKDGNDFDVFIYSKEAGLAPYIKAQTYMILDELERTWGPWPHPSLVINAENSLYGGMEYHGATITSSRALRHELLHSYFARGVMPADGNSGWIDEAIARWSDNLFFQNEKTSFKFSEVAAGSPYQRLTHPDSYNLGSNFLGYISNKFKDRDKQIKFLRKFFKDNVFKTVTTDDFEKALSAFLGEDLKADFKQYIFSKKPAKPKATKVSSSTGNP
jgi:hypothetical protein